MTTPTPNSSSSDERPPILKSWNQLYALVLILHALIIFLFYVFTESYS